MGGIISGESEGQLELSSLGREGYYDGGQDECERRRDVLFAVCKDERVLAD
jgi:hypothetical protein